MNGAYDPVELGILWDRVVSIADEIVTALIATSFSTMVRESGDLSCMLFDARGKSLAQGAYSVPSFTGTGPPTMQHMLRRFPPETLEPGDVLITNDPWMGTGHLYDINVMRPVFHRGRLVAFTLSVTHLPDIGGAGYATTARDVFEEGLWIPIAKLMRAGRINDELMEIVLGNVRLPDMVRGDIMANVTCNEVGGRLIGEFMDECGLADLSALSDQIILTTEQAMRQALRRMPAGTYRNAFDVEGVDGAVRYAVAATLDGGSIAFDFTGTDPIVNRGINVPFCYTSAFCNYAVKALTIPQLPNNEGAARPIALSAPPGCLLNAERPAPTGGRHVMGHFVAPLIFGALAQAIPGEVQADSGMLSQLNCTGRNRQGQPIASLFFASGGFGALAGIDGRDACPGPSNMIGTPIEVWESETSMRVLHKEIVADSGGAGAWRGGNGQRIKQRNDTGHPLAIACFAARDRFPPQGVDGGRPGGLRQFLLNDQPIDPKGRYVLAPGGTIETLEAGGGGAGDPRARAVELVLADVRAGLVSPAAARRDYGVEIDPATGRAWRR
ncbi:MAG: hydantoinase B/oxoprolinase family protein [Alphaproteobacteria bacterium]|nr:hydantoinase B/oxoprolinase family protein [Alphaproteobacteria bacterium]